MNRRLLGAVALAIVGLVAVIYLPAVDGGFVWDDTTCFHDGAWLRLEDWRSFILHNFCGWTSYFRPLVVALLALEVRYFDAAPAPMHIVSIGIHLANTLLVGLLAWTLSGRVTRLSALLVGGAMLCYGLHPALIEPVFWIGCQFDLVVTLLVLAGLLLNATLRNSAARAVGVAGAFFLAACTKETAVSFPLLLLFFDLAATPEPNWSTRLHATWQRQRWVYLSVLGAGIGYLILRHLAMGALPPLAAEPLFAFSRLQKVCLTYLSYWQLIVWPRASIGPIHPFDQSTFADITLQSLAIDAGAAAIALGGIYTFVVRRPLGNVVFAVTIALLPTLNLIPIPFIESLYHDRYAILAVAMTCVLLPSVLHSALATKQRLLATVFASIVGVVWFACAVVSIRGTLPLWADELALWQWVLKQHPDSITAKDHLLSTYMGRNDHVHARELADQIVAENARCPVCLLNAAYLAIADNDEARASLALDKLKMSPLVAYNPGILHGYIFASGELLKLQNDLSGAEEAYRDAINLNPYDPIPQMELALLLASEGKPGEARKQADIALALFATDEREQRRASFEATLAASQAKSRR